MVRFRLVGVPQLRDAGGGGVRLERRDAALLALLMLGGPQPRGRLASLLWPRVSAERARNSLRQRLHRLKKAAGQEIVLDTGVLQLRPHLVEPLDATLWTLDERPDAEIGGLLDGMNYEQEPELDDWLAIQRERWRQTVRDHLGSIIDALHQRGESAVAVAHARRLVREDPLNERAHLRLVRQLYASGDAHATLVAYAEAARHLESFGASPGSELEALRALALDSSVRPVPGGALPALPDGLLRPPRLVGRDAESARIASALTRQRVVAIVGEAGIGKSRLLRELADARRWPPPVSARLGDADLPYALLSRCVEEWRRHAGEPAVETAAELWGLLTHTRGDAGLRPEPLQPTRVLQAVERFLRSWRRRSEDASAPLPGLAIDDLQFADSASLLLLLNLAADPDPGGPAWAIAIRQDELPDALSNWYRALDPRRVEIVELQPLEIGGIVDLLDSLQLPGLDARQWAEAMREQVGGRPFDLLDTLAALYAQGVRDFSGPPRLEGHPARRREAIARRLGRLDDLSRQLVQVAAIAGSDFCVELAAAVLGRPAAGLAPGWRTLEQAGLFAGDGFAHDIVRQTARAEVPEPIARAIHRQVAAWLVAQGSAAARPARVAVHWQRGADWSRAAPAFEAAALEARERSAGREELQALDSASQAYRQSDLPDGPDRAFECDARRVRLLLLLESTDLALSLSQSLVAQARTPRQRVVALEARALVRGERLEAESSLADAREALTLARSPDMPARLRLLAAQQASAALRRLGRPADGVELMEAERPSLAQLDDDERLHWLSDLASSLDYADRRREAIRTLDATIEEAERLGRWTAASEAWGNKSIALAYLNRLHDSLDAARQAVACGQRAGLERAGMLIDEMTLAGSLRDLGHYGEYLPLAERLPTALREAGYAGWAVNAENDLAIGYAWLGRLELAHGVLGPVPQESPATLRAARLFTEARLMRMQHGPDGRAGEELIREARGLLEQQNGGGRSYVRLKLALEGARAAPAETGLAELESIVDDAQRREQTMLAAHAEVLKLELLLRLGRHAQAAGVARAVLQRWEADGPSPSLYPPEVWWLVSRALDTDPGDAATAREVLQRARHWIVELVLPQLPSAFRASFVERNAVNAAVLRSSRPAA